MMQVPSSNSNQSDFTSRRSNRNRGGRGSSTKGVMSRLFDGIIDKACCVAPGYNVGDEVLDDDTNSIAALSTENAISTNDRDENTFLRCFGGHESSIAHRIIREDDSIMWEEPEESMQWRMPLTKGVPVSPTGSEATDTTVLTGSTNSSRSSLGRSKRDLYRPQHVRSHSTGNVVHPEDEWLQQQQQQQAEDRRIKTSSATKSSRRTSSSGHESDSKKKKKQDRDNYYAAPREVVIPTNWTQTHGLRRMQSDTYRLPFQTVQPEQKVYYRSNN